ncbi:MAG: radical SAM protein [Deltaproteobacteria bacterium]|nr:radical SAM protein [Patescibacteria group bacterium]MCL5126770.1 radical SAM protein [Deltaproteobacteria bacterium]
MSDSDCTILLGELTEVLEVQFDSPPDYSLFKGEKCIPRLMLSDGCLFRCSFCTVPTTLTVVSPGKIEEQVEELKVLDFKLIFINDKSFGQAKNWRAIREVFEQVHRYNQDFLGFIVQTPPSLALKDRLMEAAVDLGVKYMEFGVETVSDEHLALFNKPYRVKHLDEACERARRLGLKIIPNFILGIPGDDYKATIEWVTRNRDIIPVVNINFLALHFGNMRGRLPWQSQTLGDRDQNVAKKSWLSQDDLARMRDAMETIYAITSGS